MSSFLMTAKVISIMEHITKSFFWEGHKGSKIDHLAKWDSVSKYQVDGGLSFGDLKGRNWLLLAK